MANPLLITKLNTPSVRPSLVPRQRLTDLLDRGLAEGRRLSVISAPAGYGKTTLAAEWLSGAAAAGRCVPWMVTWLALDDGDNDPARFFAYLVAALQKVDAGIGQAALNLLSSPRLPATTGLLTTLINDVVLAGAPIILVLDDYHTVHTPLIHEALEFLCQHAPPNLHLVLLTREDPPISTATLRARGQLSELRTRDLRFTDDEACAFFAATMGLQLDPAAVSGLEARTEGWIAGLQLAALSIQGCDAEGVGDFVRAFSGSDRYVMDYLVEQVLRRLPSELRDFMCQVAILDRMCASLCDAVVEHGAGEPGDGKTLLALLDQANLFLVRLDTQGQWYRFHHLFAELLRLELDADRQAMLHRRAAAWFQAQNLLSEAVHHALAAGDYGDAGRLVCRAAGNLLRTSELRTLLGWIDRLPADLTRQNDELAAHRALALFFTGEIRQAAAYLDSLEPSTGAITPRMRGRLLVLRAWLANMRSDIAAGQHLAQEALALMGDDEPFYRMAALLPLGHAQSAAGHTPAAERTFRETVAMGRQAGHALATLGGTLDLAFNLLEQGRRRESVRLCQDSLRQYVDGRGALLPLAGVLYLPLASLAYQADCLGDACDYARRGLEASRQMLSEDIMGGDGEMILALAQYAVGEVEPAFATLREARLAAEKASYHRVAAGFAAVEAELHLREGNLPAARRWVESSELTLGQAPAPGREILYRVYTRFLLADGRLEEARQVLSAMERLAVAGERRARLIIVRIWQAMAAEFDGSEAEALGYLGDAVGMAAPEDFRRLFLDAGQPELATLLPGVRGVAPEFVDGLLARLAAGGRRGPQPANISPAAAPHAEPGAATLLEPLTARELEVLGLLSAGLTYRQIAERLVVAIGTVQAHCGNIYGKLGVNNRTQALTRARDLGLI